MTIQEYAEDMNFTIQDVLNECNKLGIKATSKDDMLSDDDIVMLDNTMNLMSANDDLTLEENDVIDDAVEDIMMIGYPNALWDSEHNMPIIRKGITATPVWLDHNGKKDQKA